MSSFVEAIKKNKDDLVKPICVLLCICIVIPAALALTNKITEQKIEDLATSTQNDTMKLLLDADEFDEKKLDGKDGFSYFEGIKAGKTVGYIFITSSKGYGGEVSVMSSVTADGKIKEVSVLDVSGETPGLGQNASKKDFYKQYSGKSGSITVVKNGANKDNNEVNAVTGATITSRAVTSAVNIALDEFSKISSTDKETEVTPDEK